MNLDAHIDPDHLLALMLAIAVLCLAGYALITRPREERHRVTTPPSAKVDHALTEAAEEARAAAAPTLRELREASAARAEMARRSQDRSRERRAAHAGERRSGSRALQPRRRRQTWSGLDQQQAATVEAFLRNDVVAGQIIDLGVGRRAVNAPR